MKIKMIYSNFDEKTGISEVTIMTDIGEFKGTSKLHEEDRNISSHFAGCRYAEMRAILKYMKKKIQILKIKIKGLEELKNDLTYRKDYNQYSIENCQMRKRIYQLKKQASDWQERYKSLHSKMLTMMYKREDFIDKLTKKGDEKDNGLDDNT